jgi:hypothetical protein
MKNQAIQYLAFDVHQATVVATLRDAHGATRMRATVPTEIDNRFHRTSLPKLQAGFAQRTETVARRLRRLK